MNYESIYQFNLKKLNVEEISLSEFSGQVLLIVNTASQCGFTPQLAELVQLKNKYKETDFEILALPSNDFGGQEPLEGAAIATFCENFGANYPVFDKIKVRGPYAHPLYAYFGDKKQNGKFRSVPRWNFHKFLIGRNGMVADFYYPFVNPLSSRICKQIDRLLIQPVKAGQL
jgi:glutathione peroxidase